jgi:hypothetical protein
MPQRDGQEKLAVLALTAMDVTVAGGTDTVTGDVVDTLGFKTATFVIIPDVLDAADDIKFGAVDSPDNVTYTEVDRIKILPTSRQGDENPLEIMPGVYAQTFGVMSNDRYIKPTLTPSAAVAADITVTVLAILQPEDRPFQENLAIANRYPGDGRP